MKQTKQLGLCALVTLLAAASGTARAEPQAAVSGGAPSGGQAGEARGRQAGTTPAPTPAPTPARPAAPGAPTAAPVERRAECQFWEISAQATDKPAIAPELAALAKKLKKPPFSSWNTFGVVSTAQRTLVELKAEAVPLSAGNIGVLLREVNATKATPRMALALTMDDAAGKRVMDTKVNVDAGDFFLIGRTLANGEGHVLALLCKM